MSNKQMTHKAFLRRMKARFNQHGSMRNSADHLGVTESYLSRVASGIRPPSKTILADLGLAMEKTVVLRFSEVRNG